MLLPPLSDLAFCIVVSLILLAIIGLVGYGILYFLAAVIGGILALIDYLKSDDDN